MYKVAFLYALSLVSELDSVVTLNETIAAAALGMATNNSKAVNDPNEGTRGVDGVEHGVEHGEDEDHIDLPYDEGVISLPPFVVCFLATRLVLLCLFVSQNPKSPIDKPRRIFRRGTNTYHNLEDKSPVQRSKYLTALIHTVGIRCFFSIHRLQCDCDCDLRLARSLRCCCLKP